MVRRGQVRIADKIGNDMADEAADFGRRRVGENVLDARREFSRACRIWYPIIRDLHRFFIAIAGVIVNDDGKGGTAPDPLCWCSGAEGKRRRVTDAVRDFAMIPGPQSLWSGSWVRWPVIHISNEDVGWWPFSPGALVKLAAFLSSLSWPCEVTDLGPGGVSYLELLILHERWAGERLRIEDAIPKFRGPGRQISVSAAPLCPDIDIWKLCRYFGRMMRALCHFPGGLGRFIPGRIGTTIVGCVTLVGKNVAMDLLETSDEGFFSDLLSLIWYPSGSGAALLSGTLKLKYHTVPFACKKPTWKLPSGGGVTHILTTGGEDIGLRWGISGGGGVRFL